MNNIEHLVIFSTLNQITNYTAIQNLKPKNIYNITYDSENLKYGINPKEWDENLEKVIEKDYKITSIKIEEGMQKNLENFKEKLLKKFFKDIDEKTPIYWNITGGQRIYIIPIHEFIKEKNRSDDVIFYLEANTEKVIVVGGKNYEFKSKFKYQLNTLNFKTAFQLMGYDIKMESTVKLKECGKISKHNKNMEIEFYNELYRFVTEDKSKNLVFEVDGKKGTFKELLLESNSNNEFPNREHKQKFLIKLFEKLKPVNSNLVDYISASDEIGKGFPAGYIFEKLVGYKIFDLVKNNAKILGMEMSLKTSAEDISGTVDEIDIILLTNTGRILNFECKSGSMSGDNAKSHNFTTYALSGVFGAPIFMSPLLDYEASNNSNDRTKKLIAAINAAEKAKIKIIYLNTIEKSIKELIGE